MLQSEGNKSVPGAALVLVRCLPQRQQPGVLTLPAPQSPPASLLCAPTLPVRNCATYHHCCPTFKGSYLFTKGFIPSAKCVGFMLIIRKKCISMFGMLIISSI